MEKNLPELQETQVQSLDQENPLEKEMATHSSILAWRIPWTEGPDGLRPVGLQELDTTEQHTHTHTHTHTFHPHTAESTLFSGAHGLLSRMDHMLGHKTRPRKFRSIEIISSILSDHNAMGLEIKLQEN